MEGAHFVTGSLPACAHFVPTIVVRRAWGVLQRGAMLRQGLLSSVAIVRINVKRRTWRYGQGPSCQENAVVGLQR